MDQINIEARQGMFYIGLGGLAAGVTAFAAGYTSAAYGLLLGCLTGLISFLQLRYQMKKCVQMAPAAAAAYIQTGWFIRLSLIVAILVISMVAPQISFIAALCGLAAVWLFLLAYAMLKVIKSVSDEK